MHLDLGVGLERVPRYMCKEAFASAGKTVFARTDLNRSTLYRKIEQGSFPKQVRIAVRCAGRWESALNEWLKNPMFYGVGDCPNT
jgi:prophage regulatory protein